MATNRRFLDMVIAKGVYWGARGGQLAVNSLGACTSGAGPDSCTPVLPTPISHHTLYVELNATTKPAFKGPCGRGRGPILILNSGRCRKFWGRWQSWLVPRSHTPRTCRHPGTPARRASLHTPHARPLWPLAGPYGVATRMPPSCALFEAPEPFPPRAVAPSGGPRCPCTLENRCAPRMMGSDRPGGAGRPAPNGSASFMAWGGGPLRRVCRQNEMRVKLKVGGQLGTLVFILAPRQDLRQSCV
jgi:hypothetical protein